MEEIGLSRLIGLKSAVMFLAFLLTRNSGIPIIPLLLLQSSLVSLLVAIASHPSVDLPLLLGKSSDGNFPVWSIVLFGPYLAFIRIFMILRRLKSGELAYSEIKEGLYVGGWPQSANQLPPGDPAVIDCTCELPRSKASLRNAYFCLATWDTRAPGRLEIESAVRWACRKKAQGKPIYIHCAYGTSGSLILPPRFVT